VVKNGPISWPLLLMILTSVAGACFGEQDSSAPVLSLSDALSKALEANPSVVRLRLEGAKLAETLAAARTHRLPVLQMNVLASEQLREVDFLFRRGLFGAFPGLGPIPSVDTRVVTPRVPTALVFAQVAQPLTQQFVIGLNLRQIELQIQANEQKLRGERLRVIADVKKAYYAILLTQNGLAATRKGLDLYRELDRVTREYVVQKVALQSDRLEVETRQAKAEYDALVLEDQLATQKQQLNLLLGRTIDVGFSVSPVDQIGSEQLELADLRRRALEQRPEIREALLRVQQAELDRRIKKADRIPELSLALTYFSPLGFNELLPTHVTSLGLLFKWDVYDWGRRKRELAAKGLTLEQARSGLEEARSQVQIDVAAKYRKLQETRQLLRIAKLGSERAGENLRVASNKYQQEYSLLKDVLQAQTELEQARSQQEQALLAFWGAKAELEKALGEEK
jgi:outer membrane protein